MERNLSRFCNSTLLLALYSTSCSNRIVVGTNANKFDLMIRQEGLSQDVISMKNVAFNDLGFFGVALFCLFVMYYVGGYSVQFLFPQIFGLKNLQKKKRPKGQIRRDAFRSLGITPFLPKIDISFSFIRPFGYESIGLDGCKQNVSI